MDASSQPSLEVDAFRPPATTAALEFLDRQFPDCLAAFLGGSVARGEATPASDLDLVIITPEEASFRWATFSQEEWPIEAWFMTAETYSSAFAEDAKKRWPALIEMCRDGIVLRDQDGLARRIKAEAQAILDRGPEPLSAAEMDQLRFDLTSLLEDLESSADRLDMLLLAGGVFHLTATILLALHRQWFGQLDWLVRELREVDAAQADEWTGAVESLCRAGDKSRLIRAGDAMLNRVGGRLFEGQSRSTWWRG